MKPSVSYVLFTDLDGTLLDHDSYSFQPAEAALEEVRARKVPLVLCTSKTRAEVEAVRAELGNADPFIVENGAAVYVPTGYFPFRLAGWGSTGDYDVLQWGVPYPEVVAALRRASARSGCPVRGFHDLTVAQLALRCRMSVGDATRAKQREFDEPFEALTDSPTLLGALLNRIEEEGLSWTRGGRFYHIRGRHNKGQAAEMLAKLFRRAHPGLVTVGLGDGPNDLSLLQAVDLPIRIPTKRQSNLHGPLGWNRAVLRLFEPPRPVAAGC